MRRTKQRILDMYKVIAVSITAVIIFCYIFG
jgi:hypothetical protein